MVRCPPLDQLGWNVGLFRLVDAHSTKTVSDSMLFLLLPQSVSLSGGLWAQVSGNPNLNQGMLLFPWHEVERQGVSRYRRKNISGMISTLVLSVSLLCQPWSFGFAFGQSSLKAGVNLPLTSGRS